MSTLNTKTRQRQNKWHLRRFYSIKHTLQFFFFSFFDFFFRRNRPFAPYLFALRYPPPPPTCFCVYSFLFAYLFNVLFLANKNTFLICSFAFIMLFFRFPTFSAFLFSLSLYINHVFTIFLYTLPNNILFIFALKYIISKEKNNIYYN